MTAEKNEKHRREVADPKRHEKARAELERRIKLKSRLARYVDR